MPFDLIYPPKKIPRGLCALLLTVGLAATLFAAPRVTISVEDKSVFHIPYDPPNESKVKWDVSGNAGEQLGTNFLLHDVKIQEYSLAGGSPEMVVQTPACVYNPKSQEIFSSAHLNLHAQSGKLFVEGDGFLMRQTNSSLIISNHVHSLIETSPGTNTAPTSTEIFSQSCRFRHQTETEPGIAVYENSVRLTNAQTKIACELLTAELPADKAGVASQIHHIVAENHVGIDFAVQGGEPMHATGQRAVYENQVEAGRTNDWLELSGEPRGAMSNGWMTAELFVMDRVTGKLRGNHDVHVHYVSEPSPNTRSNSPPVVSDIFADGFEFDTVTRLTRFWGAVRVVDPRLNLRSEWLETVLPKSEPGVTNHVDRLDAATNVLIDFMDVGSAQTNHASGQKAAYHYAVSGTITNELLTLNGDPRITLSNGWMTADTITTDRAQGWVSGEGNQHSVYAKVPGEPPELDTEIFSDQFEFHNDTGLSIYHGHVREYDCEMNLRSPILTLQFARSETGGTNRLAHAVAESGVVIDFPARQAFQPGDITNLMGFAEEMKKPGRPIAEFVSRQLSPRTRSLLSEYQVDPDTNLCSALATDLNRVTQGGAIYQPERFAGIKLSAETKSKLEGNAKGADLLQLNRLLLVDAFHGELFRNQRGDATRGTGDRAIYSVTPSPTNDLARIELTGSPKLEKPDSWVKAQDSIIFDQATGKYYLIGPSEFLTKTEGLSAKPLEPKPADGKSKKRRPT